ncbi:hypothetical protein [Microbacterium sp. NPDC079995]|uniref:hypothetical protein n=1 Tax=unclassified Microbacterium TaxID=2609290 RepID=UPI00344FBDEB
MLRPGGSLFLGYFDADATEAFDHAVVQAYRWNTRDLQRILESAGFDVVAVDHRADPGQRGRRDLL